MQQKIGLGYDIHRLVKDRKLFLGGVEIPYHQGLLGHSDADVLLHAICDALLGALGQGDIGEHFPDTDPQYQDISSLTLLEKVYGFVQKNQYTINNIDAVIVAEEPKLKDFKQQMRETIASKLDIKQENVNIKATSQEGLGPIGEKKGIAAFATVLLTRR